MSVSTEWVRVDSNGKAYFWNVLQDTSTWTPPSGVDVVWEATFALEKNAWFYWNKYTQESTWERPGQLVLNASDAHNGQMSSLIECYRGPLSSPGNGALARHTQGCKSSLRETDMEHLRHWLQAETAMAVASDSTLSSEKYRGQVGVIIDVRGSDVTLKLPDQLGGACICLPAEDLIPLQKDTVAQLIGRDGEADKVGIILAEEALDAIGNDIRKLSAREATYRVKLVDGSVCSVDAKDLKPRCPVWDVDFSLCGEYLLWRNEQTCLFIGSDSEHHHFSIHLPLGYHSWRNLPAEERKPWPLLVYLHGNGGGSFLSNNKKSLKSRGIGFAAENFVIVSPHCKWKWTDVPSPWVAELVRTFRGADFVDHERIYLTGCSMGGMGVWEVGSRNPDMFAALAPVAAHHTAERRGQIANGLTDMPIFVCHSRADYTCPIRPESALWTSIRIKNRRMQINLMEHVDHCSVFEHSYCNDTQLYDWLLQQRRDLRR